MSQTVQSQVIAGLIVLVVGAIVTWVVRRVARSFATDIKETVKSEVEKNTAPIIAQFSNNGGKTFKDAVDRLEIKLEDVKGMTQEQGKVLGEHIAFHKGQESKT